MLEVAHNPLLVVASLAVVIMAGFTGFSLTERAGGMAGPGKRLTLAMGALALGGGIWSMHFVAMLGLTLPVPFFYDLWITVASALAAIAFTAVALLVLHGGQGGPSRTVLAGCILGAGISAMHYVGMMGMQLCTPMFDIYGTGLALVASVALSVGALHLSRETGTPRALFLATVGFAFAVFCVHFIAIAGTGFVALSGAGLPQDAVLSNEVLAIVVVCVAFAISGAFLATGSAFAEPEEALTGLPLEALPARPPVTRPHDIPQPADGRAGQPPTDTST